MSTPILTTKLYIPSPRPKSVPRPRLIERLNAGLHRRLTLISAAAGFGKTTLVSEWVSNLRLGERSAASSDMPAGGVDTPTETPIQNLKVAWLSLDKEDNDPIRFLTYLVAALQRIAPDFGSGVMGALKSPQPPAAEALLTILLNEMAAIPDKFLLVLDDYHVLEAPPIDEALTFLLAHLPPQMHLVIATREDPNLALPRLRARGQLTELRAADLRFTADEAADFLNQVMGLNLSPEEIAALETRTEGWIAGLQLAALALQGAISAPGQQNAASFIQSFTGSHYFVLDYLVEEVLQQQPEHVQRFLLHTALLDRLCGPLCEAVCARDPAVFGAEAASGQEMLAHLAQANLFIVPLDNERRWFRYHHLFGDLLRQRLQQSSRENGVDVAELHRRASRWYEEQGLAVEAFHHATAANDIDRATRLLIGDGMPLHFRGAVTPVFNWLASLPETVLDARPTLWVMYASVLSMTGQLNDVEPKLQAAEAVLHQIEEESKRRNLIGHIAAIRALLAASQQQVEAIIAQSERALANLHPDNLSVRTATTWKLGLAYQLQGERAAASQAYAEAIAASEASGNTVILIAATIGLGNVQETENQLSLAAENYRRVLELAAGQLQPAAIDAHLGLARLCYAWHDLAAAEQHIQQGLQLARQIGHTERWVAGELLLARLRVAQGEVAEAAVIAARADQLVRQHHFVTQKEEVAAVQTLILLHQGDVGAAAELAKTHELSLSLARAHVAQGDTAAALAILEPLRQQAEVRGFQDERLQALVGEAAAYHVQGEKETAVQLLHEALALAEPDRLIRPFVDGGWPIAELLTMIKHEDKREGGYIHKLLAACEAQIEAHPASRSPHPLVEPLSERELEVLQLVAEGLSNREIGEQLFLALSTVKGHNRNIYGKLQVQRRTEAVARARELGLV